MTRHDSEGAGPAACSILQALLDELVNSGTLSHEQVDAIFAAAGSTLDGWGDPQVFRERARNVLNEMRSRFA
jgi:hypothetical protein